MSKEFTIRFLLEINKFKDEPLNLLKTLSKCKHANKVQQRAVQFVIDKII